MKFIKKLTFLILLALLFTSCGQNMEKTAIVNIIPKSGSNMKGNVTFTEKNGKVFMKAAITGLLAGNHAIHIHAIGDCSAEDGKSAGGHWNPDNKNHGKWLEEPFHIGDIGNIVADKNGKGTIVRTTDLWCIDCDDDEKNIIGKAIIIHAGPDDFSSQPSGAAGPRVGCGEILLK
ncbi:MAG: Cu-Zn family superoxide dismutase [Paraglaciecola sp.]|jgi:Cu-Zn family superoxide dismutase